MNVGVAAAAVTAAAAAELQRPMAQAAADGTGASTSAGCNPTLHERAVEQLHEELPAKAGRPSHPHLRCFAAWGLRNSRRLSSLAIELHDGGNGWDQLPLPPTLPLPPAGSVCRIAGVLSAACILH